MNIFSLFFVLYRFTKAAEDDAEAAAAPTAEAQLNIPPQYDDVHLTVPARPVFNIGDFHETLEQNIETLANKIERWSVNGMWYYYFILN